MVEFEQSEIDPIFANQIESDAETGLVNNKQQYPETLEEQEALALHLLDT